MRSRTYFMVTAVAGALLLGAGIALTSQDGDISDAVGQAHAAGHRAFKAERSIPEGSTYLIDGSIWDPTAPPMFSDAGLKRIACSADAVAHIHVTGRRSFPSPDGSYIYTVYRARVLDVVKPSDALSQAESPLTFSRIGGAVVGPAGTTAMSVAGLAPLEIGKRYMVALQRAENGTFVANEVHSAFQAQDSEVRGLGKGLSKLSIGLASFVNVVGSVSCPAETEVQ